MDINKMLAELRAERENLEQQSLLWNASPPAVAGAGVARRPG